MSTNLKPIESIYDKFKVNGQEERILVMPRTRDDDVTITMGGKSEFATKISVEDFENNTGHFIVGLEPEYDYDLETALEEYKAMLVNQDFTLDEPEEYTPIGSDIPKKLSIAGGHIHFSTAKNVTVSIISYIAERGDDYVVKVRRDAGWGTKREKEFKGPKSSLPLLLTNAARTIDAYSSTKVQVLSKVLTEEENIRKYDSNGFSVLKANESVEDFFKDQEMNAGIVVNAAGKFQAFYSYRTEHDTDNIQRTDPNFKHGDHKLRSFHYNTKDYKTLKGAEKFLATNGYDKTGKSLDTLDVKEFAEAFREYTRRSFFSDMVSSWSDDEISNFSLPKGHGTIEHIQKENDEKFGFSYAMVFNYTDELTGKKYREVSLIDNSAENYDFGGASQNISNFVSNVNENLYNEENSKIEFENDPRTDAEKSKYHKEKFLEHKDSVEHRKKYMDESEVPYREAEAELTEIQNRITSNKDGQKSNDELGELEHQSVCLTHQVNRTKNRYDGWKLSFDKYEALVEHHKSAYKELSKTQSNEETMGM